jgi:hypothetical protein
MDALEQNVTRDIKNTDNMTLRRTADNTQRRIQATDREGWFLQQMILHQYIQQ